MRQNVHILTFLTAAAVILISCKIDNDGQTRTDDPEADYFRDYESYGGKWGFIDSAGNVVIPARYDLVSGFREGLAPVNDGGRWGYIDPNGDVLIPCTYRAAWQFHEGIGRVIRFDGTPCMIFRDGRTICPEDVVEIGDFSEGLATFQRADGYGYFDTSGTVAIEPGFEAAWSFHDGTARVSVHGKQGLINRRGEFIVKAEYRHIYTPSSNMILVRGEDGYMFLTPAGDRVGQVYQHATPYVDSVAAVADASGWFLINLREQPLHPERYSNLRYAGAHRWIARQGSLLGILDHEARPITHLKYQQINNFSEGYAGYLRDGLWGFIDSSGTEITPAQFGLVWDFHNRRARAAFRNGIAFITPDGEIPFRPEYSDVRDFSEAFAPYQE